MGYLKKTILWPLKFKMADGRILKIVNSPYLNETSSDSEEIWCTRADLELDNSHETKY